MQRPTPHELPKFVVSLEIPWGVVIGAQGHNFAAFRFTPSTALADEHSSAWVLGRLALTKVLRQVSSGLFPTFPERATAYQIN